MNVNRFIGAKGPVAQMSGFALDGAGLAAELRGDGQEPLTFEDLATPTDKGLRGAFERILNHIAATDSVSTRPEQRLNETANLLILKIESDKAGAAHPGRPLFFQLRERLC